MTTPTSQTGLSADRATGRSTERTTELPGELIDSYRRNGFVHIPGVLDPDEVATWRAGVEKVYAEDQELNPGDATFKQVVNVWRGRDEFRDLTLHPRLAGYATQLAGIPLRIWHDHLLAKAPHNGAATEFHQDAPYWPHDHARHSLSAWIALVDVPVERGCMTFIGGQQDRRDIRAIDLHDSTDLFSASPDLQWLPRTTIPLRAGDVTFHNGYTPHTANANDTDDVRFAFVVIYVDRDLAYNGKPHPCTDGLGIEVGGPLPDEVFPPVP
jgi:ectoine hydroxylase-related dioxygenase (phytanoyl-CoA dioxygenase family)